MALKDDTEHSASHKHIDNDNRGPVTLVQQIEAETKRPITIQTATTSETLAKCNQQLQSPLFTLPAEIREIIFSLVAAPYYVPNSLFEETSTRRHPDHLARISTSTSLLSICRRIWLEANHLPMQQAHHCFTSPDQSWRWVDPNRSNSGLTKLNANLTRNNRPLLKTLHVFVDMRYFGTTAKGYLVPLMLGAAGACPEVLTLTIRRATWPDARFDIPTSSEALDHGLKALLTYQALPRLREIRLELENFEDQVEAELRPKIALLREQYALVNRLDDRGNVVHVELQPPGKERIWSGAVTDDEERLLELSRGSVRKRRIVEVVWKVEKVREEHEGEGQVEVDVPGLEFSDADRGPLGSANVEIKRQWEEKWDQEGSLLKFVE